MEYLPGGGQMKAADQYTIQTLGVPSLELMERAAGECVRFFEEAGLDLSHVCIVCGSGNNGGDGFAIGRILLEKGGKVTLLMAGNRSHCTEETAVQMERFVQAGGRISDQWESGEYSIIVDAVFGVGLSREVGGSYRELIRQMNASSGTKVAVDIPSGVSADTGQVLGIAFAADYTVTFQARKIGLLLYPGTKYAGQVIPREIGISEVPLEKDPGTAVLLSEQEYAQLLPERPEDSHKGTYGRLLVIAGSKGMSGAAFFNAAAAYTAGAGLVQIYTPEENRPILQQILPEAIVKPYQDYDREEILGLLSWADVVLCGSGLGAGETSRKILETVALEGEKPAVIDADGLNLLGAHREWLSGLRHRDYIFTPHLKEMERLTGIHTDQIRANRLEALRTLAAETGLGCVLKDSVTLIQKGEGRTYLNPTGNSAMAKAGSGDVLAGIIAGLLAQGISCEAAALLGTWLHGRAGDLAREEKGRYSVLARDLIGKLAQAMKETDENIRHGKIRSLEIEQK